MKIPRNALKTLCCVLVLPILIAALSVPVLGVEKLTFKDTANTNGLFDDGGYYILDGTEITVTATEANGIEIEGNGYCTWAFYKDVITNYPYLVYTIADDPSNGFQQMQATSYYAGGYLIDIPSDPGTHVINLIEHFADQAEVTLGYYYVIIFASGAGKTFVDEVYLSSADPTQETGSDTGNGNETGNGNGNDTGNGNGNDTGNETGNGGAGNANPDTNDGILTALSILAVVSVGGAFINKKKRG